MIIKPPFSFPIISLFTSTPSIIKTDCDVFRNKVLSRLINTHHIGTSREPADIFVKGFNMTSYNLNFFSKLGLFNLSTSD